MSSATLKLAQLPTGKRLGKTWDRLFGSYGELADKVTINYNAAADMVDVSAEDLASDLEEARRTMAEKIAGLVQRTSNSVAAIPVDQTGAGITAELRKSLSQLTGNVEHVLMNYFDARIKELETKIQDLEARPSTDPAEMEKLKGELEHKHEQDLLAKQDDMNSLTEQLTRAKLAADTARSELNVAAANYTTRLEAKLKECSNLVSSSDTNRQKLEQQQESLRADLESRFQTELEKKGEKVSELEQNVATIEGEKELLSKKIEKHVNEIRHLEESVGTHKKELESALQAKAEAINVMMKFRQEVMPEAIKQATEGIASEMQAKIVDLQTQLGTKDEEIAGLDKREEETRSWKAHYEMNERMYSSDLTELKKLNRDLVASNEKMRGTAETQLSMSAQEQILKDSQRDQDAHEANQKVLAAEKKVEEMKIEVETKYKDHNTWHILWMEEKTRSSRIEKASSELQSKVDQLESNVSWYQGEEEQHRLEVEQLEAEVGEATRQASTSDEAAKDWKKKAVKWKDGVKRTVATGEKYHSLQSSTMEKCVALSKQVKVLESLNDKLQDDLRKSADGVPADGE